jgi:methylated-DNA-[protein]-cysteine S-methyltransferase
MKNNILRDMKMSRKLVKGDSRKYVRDALYMLLMLIPVGKVTTYASLARVLGTSPRAVGRLLAMNRNPIVVPCHRVVRRDGSLGGYTPGGPRVKERILRLEGVRFKDSRVDPSCIVDIIDLLDPDRLGKPRRRPSARETS